ncbi:hypothetical protein [Actinospongicola halichondriae]|uniref:hypothetical protein n=1 Tax=Actinospongicola halichondriae TaxID=3236844 RepID=UPI003D4E0437
MVPGGVSSAPGGGEQIGDEPLRRRTWLVVAAVLGAMALLVGTVAFVVSDDDSDPVTAPTTTAPRSSTTEPSTPSTQPAESVSPEAFLAVIEDLEAYVAEARGLDWVSEVEVELLDDAAFEARLLEDFEEDADEIADAELFYRALGLLRGDASLLDELRAIYSSGVLGFYDPETNELVVRGTSPTPYVQQTIVHELVHALDDQHFELDRPEYEDRKDEISTGFSAAVEGDARRIENQWMGEQPTEFREQASAEEQAFAEGIDVEAFPEILLFQIGAPYQLGEIFVGQVVSDGGERAVDAAITDPPDTSEQFLFPPLYRDREPRIEVPVPPADGEVVDDFVVGALFLFGLLTTDGAPVNQTDAVRAVDGWGGDWAVVWTDDDLACVRIDLVGDTDGDTGEIEDALMTWSEETDTGRVSTTDDGRVRLESCASSAGAVPPQV